MSLKNPFRPSQAMTECCNAKTTKRIPSHIRGCERPTKRNEAVTDLSKKEDGFVKIGRNLLFCTYAVLFGVF